MNQVYLHKAFAPDEHLGHVNELGKVYESKFGPDRLVGRIDLRNGKIYESRTGPDEYIGRIDSDSGNVYLEKLGPDEYLGHIEKDGKCYLHKRFALDDYLGKVTELQTPVHAAGAFLLLIIPAFEEETGKKVSENSSTPGKKVD